MNILTEVHVTAASLPPIPSTPERNAAPMLCEEIEKRTQLRLKVQSHASTGPAFVVDRAEQMKSLAPQLAGAPSKAEEFSLTSSSSETPVAVVTGYDDRAVVFGTGYLLRRLHMDRQRLEFEPSLNVISAPKVRIRGHSAAIGR